MRHRETILRRHGLTCRRVSKPSRRTIASGCTSAPWLRCTEMGVRERSRNVTRPTAREWPPRTRNIPTTRRSCSTVSRSWATSARARRDSRCRAARSISSNRSTRPTSSILGCCTTSFTPTTIRFMPKQVCRLRASMPRRRRRCRTRITCRRTSSRAWATGTRRRPPTRTRGRFQTTM